MSLQPRFGLLFSKSLLASPPALPFLPHSSLTCLILVPQATEDQMRLLRLQRRLEDELGGQFLDLSLHDTVTTLILNGHNKRAEQLARDFRIPDKRYVGTWAACGPRTTCLFCNTSKPRFLQALVAKADCTGRFGRLGGTGKVF